MASGVVAGSKRAHRSPPLATAAQVTAVETEATGIGSVTNSPATASGELTDTTAAAGPSTDAVSASAVSSVAAWVVACDGWMVLRCLRAALRCAIPQ